jgi:oligoendopeptidase F
MTATINTTSKDLQWDLSSLYAGLDDPRLALDQTTAQTEAESFAATYRGRISSLAPEEFRSMMRALERIQVQAARPVWYAGLCFAAQTDEAAVKVLLDGVRARSTQIGNLMTFAHLELMNLPDDSAARLLEPSADLGEYAHAIQSARRYGQHTLSEAEERLMNTKTLTGRSAWTQLYTEITSAIRITITVDGEAKQLTVDEVRALRSRPDRDLRRRAVEALYTAFEQREHVLTYIFNTLYQDWKFDTELRHYDSPIAATVLRDELTPESVEALMSTTEANADLVQAYYPIKARLLGITDFSSHDLLAPFEDSPKRYSFVEGRDLVLSAVNEFSPELAALCEAFFIERRIDALPRPGKRGGAFCSSFSPADHAFILTNFNGRLDDVFTLAHELGHGVHAELARVQNPTNFGHSLPLAETASTFMEMVLLDYLMKQADERTRRDLLANLFEDAVSTIFRQVQITRWEQLAHDERRKSVVSSDRYGELWLETYRRIYADAVTPSDYERWGWIAIPHVVGSRFYCYSYAFGNLLVYALYERYRKEGQAFVPKYLDFLRSGQSETPDALVARLGVDLNDPNFWQSGFDFLKAQLETFKALT